jgi:hypothetical protein
MPPRHFAFQEQISFPHSRQTMPGSWRDLPDRCSRLCAACRDMCRRLPIWVNVRPLPRSLATCSRRSTSGPAPYGGMRSRSGVWTVHAGPRELRFHGSSLKIQNKFSSGRGRLLSELRCKLPPTVENGNAGRGGALKRRIVHARQQGMLRPADGFAQRRGLPVAVVGTVAVTGTLLCQRPWRGNGLTHGCAAVRPRSRLTGLRGEPHAQGDERTPLLKSYPLGNLDFVRYAGKLPDPAGSVCRL